MISLRPYQHALRDACAAEFNAGHRQVLAVAPTGAGKTVTFIDIATRAIARDRRVCLLMHRQELIDQTSRALGDFPHGIIRAGHRPARHLPLQIASVQTLVHRTALYGFDLIIVDECFPAGTLIDGKPIEDVRPGDMVDSLNMATGQIEKRRVVRLFKNKAPQKMIAVHVWGGAVFTCTESHPIFVAGRGWIAAKEINNGDLLIANGDANVPIQKHMCSVRDSVREEEQSKDVRQSLLEYSAQVARQESGSAVHCVWDDEDGRDEARTTHACQRPRVLLCGMQEHSAPGTFIENDGRDEQEVLQRTHENQQSDEQTGSTREDGEHIENHRAQAAHPGWQWETNAGTATAIVNCAGMGNGSRSADTGNEVEEPEDRHCEQESYGGHRSGWRQSPRTGKEEAGYGERAGIAFARVDRIEVHEQGGDGEFGRLCPDGYVYNFEVEGNNNYFANGFLVHNCHHSTARTYMQILEAYPFAHVLGVTATPCRTDGRGLKDAGYTAMVLGPSVAWLTAEGYLSPMRVYSPRGTHREKHAIRAGEFEKASLVKQSKAMIVGDVIEHYRRFAHKMPAIGFAVSVAEAERWAAEFCKAGYSAASIDGKKSDFERRRLIGALGTGELDVLMSCDLISEGVDVPVVSCIIDLAETASKARHKQKMGRGMRMYPGKQFGVVLDHVANCIAHGLPDQDEDWSLDAPPAARKRDADPDVVSVRCCTQCLRAHAAAPVCPYCGYEYPIQARTVDEVAGELELIDAEFDAAARKMEVAECRTLEDLQRLAAERGYKPGWAYYRWQARTAGRKQTA